MGVSGGVRLKTFSQRLKRTSGARVVIISRCSIHMWSFSLELSDGNILELLNLKNDAECTSQRLTRTSGARVMIIPRCSIHKWSLSLELSDGNVLELLVLKHDAKCTSQRLKWTSGARVIPIIPKRNKKSVSIILGRLLRSRLFQDSLCSRHA